MRATALHNKSFYNKGHYCRGVTVDANYFCIEWLSLVQLISSVSFK